MIIVPDKDDNTVKRRALLLHCAGPDVQDIFDVLADTWSAKDYQMAEDALTRHFVTKINTPYERHLFREMVQGEDETINQFAIRLRRTAQQCDYGDQMEAQIRNQIISKSRSNELRRQLLKKRLKPHTSNLTGDCPELRGSKKTNAEYESLQFVSEPS